ncbi:hypothetical protein Tco_0251597 [Tanacetum coccineum]
MTSLADKSLLSGGDNKPPMLEKHLYDSWKSRMELYMMNRPHGRMILASVEKGPLVWPSITEDGVTRLKEYGPYAKPMQKPKRKGMTHGFSISVVMSKLKQWSALTKYENSFFVDLRTSDNQPPVTVITHNAAYQADDLDAYDSDCDELNSAKIALMANLSRNGSDALTEVHNQDNLNYDLFNQSEQIMTSSEQSNDVSQSETDIISDSNIIPYSQYLSETQQETVQNSNSSAQQDVLILSMFDQITTQVTHCNTVNKALTYRCYDRYKERLKFERETKC